MTIMADPGNFLTRWSRLKLRARTPSPDSTAVTPGDKVQAVDTPAPELPPVESLTVDSDFSTFMQPGVPEATRNAALRKLWGSDPVFANLDGLVEYGDDFAADFKSAAVVRTVYRVLQGMPGGSAAAASESAQVVDASASTKTTLPTESGSEEITTAPANPTSDPGAVGGRADKDGLD
jgi:Protein of unknown function (DUF3306)